MKTAASWVENDHCGMENVARWVREYKAKMPAGNIFDSNGQLVTEGGEVFTIDMEEFEERESELAKAWEAGRADTIGVVFQHCQPGNGSLFAAIDDDAAKLQPPGGKAK